MQPVCKFFCVPLPQKKKRTADYADFTDKNEVIGTEDWRERHYRQGVRTWWIPEKDY
jgi:hypothetical protein